MKKNLTKTLKIVTTALVSTAMLAGCSQTSEGDTNVAQAAGEEAKGDTVQTDSEAPLIDLSAYDISQSQLGTVNADGLREITAIADLTPHSELLEYIEPSLEAAGLKVVLVATAADSTTLEKTQNGEIDFSFYAHWPYVNDQNETNGFSVVNAGDIHVEPIRAYSDKYTSVDEISDG
ncbi:MetQ/NlpA family ABC transporter substrate-binding protein, partial [Butyrivibrio sp.]|uniref:MetQ/NlpA family ABC transporter substrate-binding protein n=1 Tax=Butyrivibrio sp. TaxID=28121 RepID=UPI0025CD6C8C